MSFNSPFTGNVVQPTDVSYRSVTLSANTQLEWPINGNATNDYAARIMEVTATAAGLQLWMPPANQTSVGNDAMIRNVGANTFTVFDYNGANTIVSVAPGEAKYIYITSNPTVEGTWGIIAFGAGASSVDAATLAGLGLVASGVTLNQSHPVIGLAAPSTFAASQRAQVCIWSGGAGSVTLPSAATLGNNWFTMLKNAGTGTLTVNTTGVQTIDGSTQKNFQPGDSAFIICTGSFYITVGYGVSSNFEFTVLTKPVTGGPYTLTASEAANNIQKFTGTLTSNVVVTYPPVVNLYVVSNQTNAGGNTLTLTTGIVGSASAQIPPSGQATLICDGTNFLNANTFQAGATVIQLTDGNVGSPSLQFALETNTGIYRIGLGQFGITVLGNLMLDVSTTGISSPGTGTFVGGISGGVF
jgi:hypothetical protein